jgi:hypothetical protein
MTLIVVARVFRRGVFLVIGKKNLASEEASCKSFGDSEFILSFSIPKIIKYLRSALVSRARVA